MNVKQKMAFRRLRAELKELREKDYEDSKEFETELRFALERNKEPSLPSFGIDRTGFF